MSNKQLQAFLNGEGARWLERNSSKLPIKGDKIIQIIGDVGLAPTRLLEVGCADGWRLRELDKKYPTCFLRGIDPSPPQAEPNNRILYDKCGAECLPFRNNAFDLVIYGWCLYLCDREDLFRIAMEGDRVLEDGGHIIVHDFHPDFSHSRKYEHKEGLHSYKMDHSKLWLGNPAYTIIAQQMFETDFDTRTSITVLRKNLAAAWPIRKPIGA